MKQKDPRLQTAKDIRGRKRRQTMGMDAEAIRRRRRPDRRRPRGRDRTPPRTKKGPPIPWAVPTAVGSAVLLILAIFLNYYVGFLYYISYLVLVGALLAMAATVYLAIDFYLDNKKRYTTRAQAATIAVVIILVTGLVIGSYVFSIKEPYNDWSYEASMTCSLDCQVELPIPMMDKDHAFFKAGEVRTDGAGHVQIDERRYEGEDILVLSVHWSGNFTLRVSKTKDYRSLPMDRHGLWNSTMGQFVVVGRKVPDDNSTSMSLEFQHQRRSQYPDSEQWSIQGQINLGLNMYDPVND
jgi:hypothetical protein